MEFYCIKVKAKIIKAPKLCQPNHNKTIALLVSEKWFGLCFMYVLCMLYYNTTWDLYIHNKNTGQKIINAPSINSNWG